MKKLFLTAVAALMMALPSLFAQRVYTDWHDIDAVTIYQPLAVADYTTLYLPPVDDRDVDFSDSDASKTEAVFSQLGAFRQILKDDIEKAYPNLKVVLVDEVPAELGADEMVLNVRFSEFNLGSRAARIWIGFGAGAASIQLKGRFTNSANETMVEFKQRRMSASMKDYPQLVKKFENTLSKDILTILKHSAD